MKTLKLGGGSASQKLGGSAFGQKLGGGGFGQKLGGSSSATLKPLKGISKPNQFESTKFIPKKYELFSQDTNKDMVVFSGNATNPEKDELRLEGIVESMYQARPVMDEQFEKLNSYRTHSMNKSSAKMATISERQILKAERVSLRPRNVGETMKEREERKRKKEDSRRHLDIKDDDWKENTTTDIFKAFDIQAYYTAEDLANTIKEPVGRIRPLISELCQYNKSGPFAQKYELKDEFKTVAQRERKDRDVEEHKQKQLDVQRKRKEERDREKTDEQSKKRMRLA